MKMKSKLAIITSLAALLASAAPANAHHAFSAEFDADKPLELTGVVTKLELVNPHSWVYVDVKNADGTITSWGAEFGAPFSLKEKGLTKGSVPVGSTITIRGYRSKNPKPFAYAVSAKLPDGREVQTGGAADAPGVKKEEPVKAG
jgi:hypothetical protein